MRNRKQLPPAKTRSSDTHKRVGLLRPRQGQLVTGGHHSDSRHDTPVSFPFTFHKNLTVQGTLGLAVTMFLAVELVLVFGSVRSSLSLLQSSLCFSVLSG